MAHQRDARAMRRRAKLDKLVDREVFNIETSLPKGIITYEDLFQFGYVGLLEAQRRFDPTRGVLLESFARHRIRGAIFDGLRKMGLLKRRRLEALRRQDRAQRLLGEPQPEDPKPSRVKDAHAVASTIAHLALEHLLEDSLSEPEASPEDAVISADLRARVQGAVGSLDEADQEVIEAIYDLKDVGHSGAALARARGMSRSSVSRRHLRVLKHLRAQLE